MPDNLLGGQGATLLTAIIIVAVALLALVGVFWLIRKRASSTFIRGGKNRQPRLAVLDATAVDTRRRLVLIRRDDVEHLVMIGGPTDIVIESRITRSGDQMPLPATPELPQRMAQPEPAKRPAAVQKPRPLASPDERSFEHPGERAPQPATAGSQPPLPPQPPMPTPAAAVVTATASVAGSIRSEAADVLDSARTRVFEEPSFDESAFDDLTAVPPPSTQAKPAASARHDAPSRTAEPASAPTLQAPVIASAAEAERIEAADLLENARTRVFEEPNFDESAFDDLTASPEPVVTTKPAAATSTPSPSAAQPRPSASDFESVLAAELSDDLSLDASDDGFFAEQYNEHQLDPSEAEMIESPEVKPEPQPSRDSLEAEMERLLGDLSRKP